MDVRRTYSSRTSLLPLWPNSQFIGMPKRGQTFLLANIMVLQPR